MANTAVHSDPQLALARVHVQPGQTVRDALRSIGEIAAVALGIQRFAIWLMTPDRSAMRLYFLRLPSGDDVVDGTIVRVSDVPTLFQALEAERFIVVEDARVDPAVRDLWTSYCKPLGIGALLGGPIYRGGQVVGLVCLERVGGARHSWTGWDREIATSMGAAVTRLFEEGSRLQAEDSLRAYQAQMLELSRLEGMGRLAAGVAHDLRNLLTVVAGHIDLIEMQQGGDAATRESIAAVREAIDRSQALSDEVLRFGRDRLDRPTILEPVAVVTGLLRMFQSTLGAHRPLKVLAPPSMSRIFADRAELERALLNLVVNARDATPNGGEITISVFEACDGYGLANQVAISVTDTGIGMDQATLAHVREPFYTTKPDGTGLGLAITQQIVGRAGGSLAIASEPDNGTTATIILPRIE